MSFHSNNHHMPFSSPEDHDPEVVQAIQLAARQISPDAGFTAQLEARLARKAQQLKAQSDEEKVTMIASSISSSITVRQENSRRRSNGLVLAAAAIMVVLLGVTVVVGFVLPRRDGSGLGAGQVTPTFTPTRPAESFIIEMWQMDFHPDTGLITITFAPSPNQVETFDALRVKVWPRTNAVPIHTQLIESPLNDLLYKVEIPLRLFQIERTDRYTLRVEFLDANRNIVTVADREFHVTIDPTATATVVPTLEDSTTIVRISDRFDQAIWQLATNHLNQPILVYLPQKLPDGFNTLPFARPLRDGYDVLYVSQTLDLLVFGAHAESSFPNEPYETVTVAGGIEGRLYLPSATFPITAIMWEREGYTYSVGAHGDSLTVDLLKQLANNLLVIPGVSSALPPTVPPTVLPPTVLPIVPTSTVLPVLPTLPPPTATPIG